MARWFQAMFGSRFAESDLISLYHYDCPIGRWRILVPGSQLAIMPSAHERTFYASLEDEHQTQAGSVCEAIRIIAEHRVGLALWDSSPCQVSDYLPDWKRDVSDRALMNLMNNWIEAYPNGSLRSMVEYFEHEPTHLLNRVDLANLLTQMMVTGQLSRCPTLWMVPSEMRSVARMARHYGLV